MGGGKGGTEVEGKCLVFFLLPFSLNYAFGLLARLKTKGTLENHTVGKRGGRNHEKKRKIKELLIQRREEG